MTDLAYTIAGFGKDPARALKDAESRLPFPLKKPENYAGIKVRDAVKAEGDMYKVEIAYNLKDDKKGVPEKKTSASSAGPTDPMRPTRDLTELL